MTEILLLAAGAAVGALAATLWAWRGRARLAQQAAEAASRASAAEGLTAEVRTQSAKASAEAQALRVDLDAQVQQRVRAETQLAEALRGAQEQRALLDDARAKLIEAFKALSSDALKSNNQAFLDLARTSLQSLVNDAKGDFGKRQEAIDALVKPLGESLQRYELHVRALEESRLRAYAGLEEQLKLVSGTQQQLQKETGNLVTALRNPQVRGRWGEMTLHRVVELAGMSEHCDYSEQLSVDAADNQPGDDGARKLRPDMVVHLPNQRDIVIDSKVSLDAYLRAISAETEAGRADALRQHAAQIRTHMQKLSAKSYWEQFAKAPEFVVMFIPGESFFAAALDNDPSLLDEGMQRQVVLATPTTLISLLRAVAFGWRQERMARNAQAVCDLGKELYDRIKVLSNHMIELGRSLKRSNESYNKAVGSMETRVLPSARKFQAMGVSGGEEIAPVEPLEVAPRLPAAEEDEAAPSPSA